MTQTSTIDPMKYKMTYADFAVIPDEERLLLRLRQLRNDGYFGAVIILDGMRLVPAKHPERLASKDENK